MLWPGVGHILCSAQQRVPSDHPPPLRAGAEGAHGSPRTTTLTPVLPIQDTVEIETQKLSQTSLYKPKMLDFF